MADLYQNRFTAIVNQWAGNNIAEYAMDALEKNMTAEQAREYLTDDHWLEDMPSHGFLADLMREALAQVNWQQIADHANAN